MPHILSRVSCKLVWPDLVAIDHCWRLTNWVCIQNKEPPAAVTQRFAILTYVSAVRSAARVSCRMTCLKALNAFVTQSSPWLPIGNSGRCPASNCLICSDVRCATTCRHTLARICLELCGMLVVEHHCLARITVFLPDPSELYQLQMLLGTGILSHPH